MQQVPGIIKDREAIGEKLRQVREAQGLTQDALAMRLGTDRKVISKHESGQQDMKMSSFIDYLEVLNVTPDQLGYTDAAEPQVRHKLSHLSGGI